MTTRAEPRIGGQKPSDKRTAVARALSALFSFN